MTQNKAVTSGGIGAALGVALVVMLPKFTELVFSPEEASIMTAALGVIFGYLVRYLPQPGA